MLSVISLPPLEPIRDSLEPIELPAHSNGAIILVGIALAMLIALGLHWAIRWKSATASSPMRRAQRRLSSLDTAAAPREIFDQLRIILAEYLSARAGVAAIKQTSPEILASLQQAGFTTLAELRDFLDDCDRTRFSTAVATSPRLAIDRCRQVIEGLDAAV